MNFIIDNYDKLFNSEESLKRLEEIILDLAVKGKLVPQDPSDEPASVLLGKIKAEKEQLIKDKKIKKDKELPLITEEEIPFEIPENWEWVRLGEIVDFKIGKTPSRHAQEYWDNGIYNWVSIADMTADDYLVETKEKVSQSAFDSIFNGNISPKGSLLMSFKLSIGKMSILKNDAFHNEAIVTITPYYDRDEVAKLFLFKCLNGFDLLKDTSDAIKGKTLNSTSMNNILLALPPLAEQKRIVEKVDKLKELINQFREKIQKRDKVRQGLKASIMNDIEKSNSNQDLLENLELIFRNFDSVVKTKEDIKDIRDLVLSLSVKGKLVPQDPNDEPASVLLEKIKAEKEQLIKDKKIKKDKDLAPITEEEIPFEIPESWEWVRLGNVAGYIQRGKSPEYSEIEEIPVVSQKCVQWSGFDLYKARFINPDSLSKYDDERFLMTGDLLWNSTGLGTLGRINVFENKYTFKNIVVDSHVTIIRPLIVDSFYLYDWFSGNIVQSEINNKSTGSTKQTELGTATIKNHIVPLPPLDEQKRIVLQVEKLMKVCDELEKLVEKSQKEANKLMGSLMNELVG